VAEYGLFLRSKKTTGMRRMNLSPYIISPAAKDLPMRYSRSQSSKSKGEKKGGKQIAKLINSANNEIFHIFERLQSSNGCNSSIYLAKRSNSSHNFETEEEVFIAKAATTSEYPPREITILHYLLKDTRVENYLPRVVDWYFPSENEVKPEQNYTYYLIMQRLPNDMNYWNFRIDKIEKFAVCILKALNYCHRKGVMHRDVKTSNILFDFEREEAFLIDFDLAVKRLQGNKSCGTSGYQAPELYNEETYNQSVDLWSLGKDDIKL
jgi:serine/threonine protein kinase